mgnify:CR=1 FL=1
MTLAHVEVVRSIKQCCGRNKITDKSKKGDESPVAKSDGRDVVMQ